MSSILKVDEIQNTGGATGLTIDSSGRMKLPNQIVFAAKTVNSSNGTVTSTYNTNLLFTTIASNDGNHFNNSTGYFTCPVAGNYECFMNVNYHDSNDWMGLYLLHNNSLVVHSWKKNVTNYEYLTNVVHAIISCSASDTLSFAWRNNYVKPSTNDNYNNCFIRFLG